MEKCYIKIIVEGLEEYAFFDVVDQLGTNENICLEIEDAEGAGNIPDLLLNALRLEVYDCIFCVYDVDNKADDLNSQFNKTRGMLLSVLGDEKLVDVISICTNPNILQFYLLAADELSNVSLVNGSKKINSPIVHKYWNSIANRKTDEQGRLIKPDYTATKWQVDTLKYSIIDGTYSYENMLENAKQLPIDYFHCCPASNLLPLLIALKTGDLDYFKKIKDTIN
ncbi:MAG: hypothetical protein E7181_01835 [Erysipelotrichaceae bacterium]|jgi:hypothetical protein|nr:hypothetical protein [Erysipelotrichaceae bacterium]